MPRPNSARPRRSSTNALPQAPSATAAAIPPAPNARPSGQPVASASASPMSVAASGAEVLLRAKNAGDSTLVSTWAGSPSASAISTSAVERVSSAPNAPCSNSTCTIGVLSTISPNIAGSASPAPSCNARFSAWAIAARSPSRTARVSSGISTVPIAVPTTPSGVSISRLAKYSQDTAAGAPEAITAPPTISNCGPELATMPGSAWRRKPRIAASNETRSGVAIAAPRRQTSISNCKSPAMPTVAASSKAVSAAWRGHSSSTIITPISDRLNSSGENAVSAKRCWALSTPISTVTGPAKAR